MPLSDFYTGAMAPPRSVNGKLVPSSLAGMYSEVMPAAPASGLVSRKVNTVDIDEATGNPIPTGGTTYYPKGPTYGYNASTGDYEVQQPGNAYASGGGKPNFDYAPSQAATAIDTAAPNLASLFAPDAAQMPVNNSRPLNLPAGGGSPVAAAPPPPPKTLMQTVADMFTPAKQAVADTFASTKQYVDRGGPERTNPNITYDRAPVSKTNGPRYTAGGDDMSSMPLSVQTSSRWNTGY